MFPGLTNVKTNNQPQVNSTGIGSDNRMVNGFATQNLGGNSLTQTMRSGQNLLGTTGAQSYQQGQDITGAALPGFNVAGNTTGTALDTTKGALDTLSPAESYWTKLLSGDKQTQLEAISPTATQASLNYGSALTGVNQNSPRGGYAGVISAGLPQAQAREVNTALYNLQPTAATNLNTIAGTKNQIAGTQGNIAGVQGQIANWLASIGVDVSKLGQTGLMAALQSILEGRGQDVSEHGQSMSLAGQLGTQLMHGIDQGMSQANQAVYRS